MDADDTAFYREHGYWISPVIVPSDVLDAAERGMERFYAGDHDHVLPDVPATRGWRPADGVVPRMRRGQVSFHHCRTVHGSSANLSAAPRRSIAIHLQPSDNRWRPGASHPNDTLVRHNPDPDYTDPAIQPTLAR